MGKLCDLKTGKSDIGTRFWGSFFHLVHTQDIIHSVLCASVCLCVYVTWVRRGCVEWLEISCFLGVKDLPCIREMGWRAESLHERNSRGKLFQRLPLWTRDPRTLIYEYAHCEATSSITRNVCTWRCISGSGRPLNHWPSKYWLFLSFFLVLDSGKACNFFDERNMVEMML